ncbi:AMP-binding protein [Metabacillus sp. RGM 3146]|uniref:AMP-binding protein n=1 Tax=Metabacillus sp. RGM 3146 TaxID=3401092 RepID=UPI003B99D18F
MTSITSSYLEHSAASPDSIALQTADEQITYKQWSDSVFQTANWFSSYKDAGSKTAAILLPNGIPFLQLFAGAASAGWIVCPLDIRWGKEDLNARAEIGNPSMIITTEEYADQLVSVQTKIILLEEFLKQTEQYGTSPPAIKEDPPFYMGFTSGSTGNPKAFVRSHGSWVESFACNKTDFQMKEQEQVLIPGPLIHSHFLYGAISTLYLGGTVFLLEKYSAEKLLAGLNHNPVTVVYLVPTMIEGLIKNKYQVNKPVTIISSGAKWEPDSKSRVNTVFPELRMYEFYGASELSFVTVLSHEDNFKYPGSVGRPCHNVKIQIRKKDGSIAPAGEIGKIYVKSNMIFLGYKHTRGSMIASETDSNGWMSVDDMGYLDKNGFVYLAGRENHMMIYGGINIFPEEIESVLLQHPLVEQAAVVGLKDSYWGEIVTAAIKGQAAKKELKSLCREKLSSYKVPRRWFFIEDMPLTSSGKIARAAVKKLAEEYVYD